MGDGSIGEEWSHKHDCSVAPRTKQKTHKHDALPLRTTFSKWEAEIEIFREEWLVRSHEPELM